MLSQDDRQNFTATKQQSSGTSSRLRVPLGQYTQVEQLPFPEPSALPGTEQDFSLVPQQDFPPVSLDSLHDPITSPGVTELTGTASTDEHEQIIRVQAAVLPTVTITTQPTTTSLRQPVVIPGTDKKSQALRPPRAQGKRIGVHMTVTVLLMCMVVGGLMVVLPAGANGSAIGLHLFTPPWNIAGSKDSNTGLVAAQIATATAVTQDGFDAGGNKTYAGVVSAPAAPAAPVTSSGSSSASDSGSLSRFAYGQCTYWANMRYHQLTGHWIPWLGNAYQWSSQASAYGWAISASPHVPSVIVLQAGVQGAGGYGHVAVVESINSDGSVTTSNWNWAGNWANTTDVRFTPGSGVSFVWYP